MALISSDGVREGWGAEKSRVDTWRDPAPTAAIAASMDGWDFVEAIMDYRLLSPPIQQLMQFELVSVKPGRTVFHLCARRVHLQRDRRCLRRSCLHTSRDSGGFRTA
jgi:hypothetical protein